MSDGIKLTFDDREFQKALDQYLDETQRSVTDTVNRKAVDICFKSSAAIKSAQIREPSKKRKKMYHALATGKTKAGENRAGSAVKGKGNQAIADKILARRKSASGYSKAIFLKMAQDLGKVLRSRFDVNQIKHAKATPARKSVKPFVTLLSTGLEASHVDQVMQPALQKGVNAVAADMAKYLADRQARIAKRYSGRKSR